MDYVMMVRIAGWDGVSCTGGVEGGGGVRVCAGSHLSGVARQRPMKGLVAPSRQPLKRV